MRKTYLFLALAFGLMAAPAQAQITLTTADLASMGDTVRILFDDSTQVLAPGPAGASQTWDFGTLQYTRNLLSQVMDASTTPDAASYPNADLAVNVGDIFIYNSLENGTDLMDHGIAGELSFGGITINRPIVYNPPVIGMVLPATFQDTWMGSTMWELSLSGNDVGITQVDSVRFVRHIDRTDLIDGHGMVYLPNDTFPDVLRLKRTEHTLDSLFAKLPFIGWTNDLSAFGFPSVFVDSSYAYQFWAAGRDMPVLQFTVDVNDTVQLGGISYQGTVPQTVGRADAVAFTSLNLYPNPTAGVATVQAHLAQAADVRVTVLDAQGRTAWATTQRHTAGTVTVDVPAQDLAPGLYIINVQANGTTQSLRMVRQ